MENVNAATGFTTADQIWRWDATNNRWEKYCYWKASRTSKVYEWRRYTYLEKTPGYEALTDSDIVLPGETFLFTHNSSDAAALLTVSGQVKPFGSEVGYSIAKGFNMFIAYPWPVELKLSDLMSKASFSSLSAATGFTTADQIWRWDATNNRWEKYCYWKASRTSKVYEWRRYTYLEETPGYEALTDNDKIAAGEGFLYNHNSTDQTCEIAWIPLQSAE